MNLKLYSFLLIIFIIKSVENTRYEDYELLLEKCCHLGANRAKQMPTAGCTFVDSSIDRMTTNSEYRQQCELVVEICCVKEHRNRNCEEGKGLAKTHSSCNTLNNAIVSRVANETVQDCCLSCKLGLMAGKDRFPCTFNAHGTFGLGYPYEEVYYECCSQHKVDGINRDSNSEISSRRSEARLSICDTSSSPCAHNCYDPGPEVGAIRCSCFKGYQLATDGRNCVDIDECEDKTHNCDLRAEECYNIVGGFQCIPKKDKLDERETQSCPQGYRWIHRQKRCADIDECLERSDNCQRLTHVCKNLLGSFTCILIGDTCPPGFKRGPNGDRDCLDVDECADRQYECQEPLETCVNSVGGYYCEQISESDNQITDKSRLSDPTTCLPGYRFSKLIYQCEDIDECRIGQHTCNLATHNCVNTDGAFNCLPILSSNSLSEERCRPGFKRNRWSKECEDINECETEYMPCRRDQSCRNTIGSYDCYCQAGYIKDAVTGECRDVNECQLGTHTCHHTLRCDNTIGSYHCVRVQDCGTGYTINAETDMCEDINECDLGINNCGQEYKCRNIEGSFKCDRKACPYNYHLSSDGNCLSNDCGIGKIFNETQHRCADINECLNSPCAPTEKCINTVGSFRCSHYCTPGYQLNKYANACEDVDECHLGTHECKGSQICRNRPGNYICECPLGYVLNQDRVCEDIDECTRYGSSVCSPDTSKCINTLGSYRCECKAGFEGDGSGRFCKDQNECELFSHTCSHKCFNTWGSYQCTCESGYRLDSDKRTCVDIDECQEFEKKGLSSDYYLCVGTCHNTVGSFRCSCPNGYRIGTDNRTCQDINECEESHECSAEDEVCLNTRGGFKCNRIVCPSHYQRDSTHKSRCKRTYATALCTESSCLSEDLNEPMAYSYNYLALTSNITIPSTGYLDLFTMKGPVLSVTTVNFEFKLNAVLPGRYGIPVASIDNFQLRRTNFNEAMVSLIKPILGPQDIELELEVKLYHGSLYGGSSKAILFIYVSEFNF